MNESTNQLSRRDWLARLAMGLGLAASYGTLAVQALLFLFPRKTQPQTRLLYAGSVDNFSVGAVKNFYDLNGNLILVKRSPTGFKAFTSTCPHLGCKVHWETDKERFFCPCHSGVFDADGAATHGPPADAGQRLAEVPLRVDQQSGVVYLEVPDPAERGA